MTIVFLDTETTGLDPFKHELLEVAMIVREEGRDKEIEFSLNIDVNRAAPKALEVNGYYKRQFELAKTRIGRAKAAALLTVYLDDAIVVGNNVQFDLRFIEHFLVEREADNTTPWYYHPVDLKALAATADNLGPPPWSSGNIAEVTGVDLPGRAAIHTAMADCRWNRDVYDAVYS